MFLIVSAALASMVATAPAVAQSAIADERANCNASFHAGCPNDPALLLTSSSPTLVEAPLPLAGASAGGAAVLVAGGVSAWVARRRRRTDARG